jgi:hypothetical protein
LLLQTEECALGIQHAQEVADAITVTLADQRDRLRRGEKFGKRSGFACTSLALCRNSLIIK